MSPPKLDRATLAWRKARTAHRTARASRWRQSTGGVAVRESKDPDAPILQYTAAEWFAFLSGAKNGEFDF